MRCEAFASRRFITTGVIAMKRNLLLPAALGLALLGSLGACSSSRTSESTGEYIDATTISTKVRSAIVADGLGAFQIGVETFKDVVQLSGFVDSQASKVRAGQVASSVTGVRSVQNNLLIK
jgi:osmotically-inducible protein OsmY